MKIFQITTLLFILLAFTGQSIAVANNCKMDMSNTAANLMSHDMSAMDHDMMNMDDHSMTNMEHKSDCCAQSCSCVVASCASLIMLSPEFANPIAISQHSSISALPTHITNQYPNSLYRPPIMS